MLVTRINEKNYSDSSFRLSVAGMTEVKKKDNHKLVNAGVAAASVGATLLGVLAVRKSQGLNLGKGALKGLGLKDKLVKIGKSFNLNYDVKEIIFVGTSSILGGLLGGFALDRDGNKKKKVTEAVFKASNITIPTLITGGLLKGFEKIKFSNPVTKIASVATGVGLGMIASKKLTNKINKKIDKDFEEKQLKPKDFLVHIDDIAGALFITKVPLAGILHLDKVLAGIYAWGGYEVGRKEDCKKA